MDAWVAQIGVGCVTHNYPQLRVSVARGLQTKPRPVDESLIHGHYLAIDNGVFDEYGPIRTLPESGKDYWRARVAAGDLASA